MPENDWEAEADIEAMARAKTVENDPARLARAKVFAERRKEEFARISESLPGKPPKKFNGAARGSRMGPK